MALYFYAYYTWVGKCLYLDDLYVKPEFRGKNIGKELLDKIIETAKQENCKKVKWQVLDWNTDAVRFYERYGAKVNGEWMNCEYFLVQ